MKILSVQQIRDLDAFTIRNEPISSYDLMERAATKLCENIHEYSFGYDHILYVCGKGNNGGDGLAMARMQAEMDVDVSVVVIEHSEKGSPDFGHNLYLLQEDGNVPVTFIHDVNQFPEITGRTVIIDAILGNGLSRPLDGILLDVVRHINSLNAFVVSIDMPTGLFADDNANSDLNGVIKASLTKTLHCPKMSLLLPESGNFGGRVEVIDIGLMVDEFQPEGEYYYTTSNELREIVSRREKFSHKGTYGHGLLFAGSTGKMGAAQLAATGALRAGVGLLTAHVPGNGLGIMQLGVREAMCSIDSNENIISEIPDLTAYNAIGFGPGVGMGIETQTAFHKLLQTCNTTLVIDADGLNILAQNKALLNELPEQTILTPHPKEFERLVGSWSNSFERLELEKKFAQDYNIILVLKGANTTVTNPNGQIFFNGSGNPGLATAGSGDVLTGIILGLLAQGYKPEDAAKLGVWLHGSAGDFAVAMSSEETTIAGDIPSNLGIAFRVLTT